MAWDMVDVCALFIGIWHLYGLVISIEATYVGIGKYIRYSNQSGSFSQEHRSLPFYYSFKPMNCSYPLISSCTWVSTLLFMVHTKRSETKSTAINNLAPLCGLPYSYGGDALLGQRGSKKPDQSLNPFAFFGTALTM